MAKVAYSGNSALPSPIDAARLRQAAGALSHHQ